MKSMSALKNAVMKFHPGNLIQSWDRVASFEKYLSRGPARENGLEIIVDVLFGTQCSSFKINL